MRKISEKEILRNIRLARDRKHRKFRAIDHRKIPRNREYVRKKITIDAPVNLGLYETNCHDATCVFIDKIRHAIIDGQKVFLDFSKVTRVYSCGTLLFLAEVDRLKRIFGNLCEIDCNYPENDKVEKVFQQVGILALLNKPPRKVITEEDKDVFYWSYKTGTCVNMRLADSMFKDIRAQLPAGYQRIVCGVEEAMTNVIHHAYELPRGDRLDSMPGAREKRWWVFAEVLDGWLYVVMCDLGIGIPRSLPRTWKDEVSHILSTSWSEKRKSLAMTKRAFKVGRTRTGLRNRGKGLKDIQTAAQRLKGKLWVTTNSVQIRYDYTAGVNPHVSSTYFRQSIMGTLIQWTVPLPPKIKGSKIDPNQLSLGI